MCHVVLTEYKICIEEKSNQENLKGAVHGKEGEGSINL